MRMLRVEQTDEKSTIQEQKQEKTEQMQTICKVENRERAYAKHTPVQKKDKWIQTVRNRSTDGQIGS